jgi:hypothetical protein
MQGADEKIREIQKLLRTNMFPKRPSGDENGCFLHKEQQWLPFVVR